jgi:outer membrane lipoprotein-sorting protein
MKIKNIIACIALAFAAQAVSAQNNAEKIIRVMVDQMRSHKNVEMVFNYQISPDGKTLGESEKGHAWLQGEAYKIEMTDQQTISDGKTIWSYLIDDEEVMVSNASEGTDNTPLKLLTSLDESYVATLSGIDAKGIATIELANPKGQYKRVTLKINTKKSRPNIDSADIYIEDGSKVVVTIKEMKFDQELDDKFFTFDAKKHPKVDVIDMR